MSLELNLTRYVRALILCLVLEPVSAARAAETLYALDTAGNIGTLLSVDRETGATTRVTPDHHLGAGSWSGLAAHPTDSSLLYAVLNPRPARFEDPQFSGLSRINVMSGVATMFPVFDVGVIGSPDIFSTAVAISPLDPDVALVVGSDKSFPPKTMIWEVNLEDGGVVGPGRPLTNVGRIDALTFAPDGVQLFGTDQGGRLVNIDPSTADVSVVGDPGLADFITGLVFDPRNDDVLFAIEAHRQDRLVTLDPSTGNVLSIIGKLGINGPEGLAFVVDTLIDLDCNADGFVDVGDLDCANAADITQQLLDELSLLPGDLNGKDGVGFGDFLVLASNFDTPASKYTEGDIDDSGTVEFEDFLTLTSNFGKTLALAPVPEPSAGLLLPMLTVIVWRRHLS